MKSVKKFTSFEELKASETKPVDANLSMQRHKAFEKVLKEIYAEKVRSQDGKQPQ